MRGSRDPERGVAGRSSRHEVDAEIRHHIAESADRLVEEGWSREAAVAEAERRFGDMEAIRGQLFDLRRPRDGVAELLRSALADAGYALRGLRASPAFTLSVIATLALGIGAASSIFSVADALLLRPLGYADAGRWVDVSGARPDGRRGRGLDLQRVRGWREAGDGVFEGWIVWEPVSQARTDGPGAEYLSGVAVTPGADALLGIPILRGRGLTHSDAEPGAPPVVLVTETYWDRLGRDPAVVGRTVRLESGPVTVVGVVSSEPKFPHVGRPPDLWLPVRSDLTWADRAIETTYGLWARLPAATGVQPAQERADARAAALQERLPLESGWRLHLRPVGRYRASGAMGAGVAALAGTVAAILLIALVNGVNLLLVRVAARTREIAVRVAVGASRGRLLRQFLLEGVVLGVLAGAAAALLAWGAVAALDPLIPDEAHFFSPHAFEVEARSLLFVFGVSLAAGTLLGLLPGVHLLRRGPSSPAAAGAFGDAGPARRRLRGSLVVAQVALSMALLALAGLFVSSFVHLARVDPGFDHERMALGILALSDTRYPDEASRADFARRLEAALEARSEVVGATINSGTTRSFGALEAEGRPVREEQPRWVPYTPVAPDWFRTMGTPVIAGRSLEWSDAGTGNAVVDRDLARMLWGGDDPLGRRFRLGEEGDWRTVVGVVDELRLGGRDERDGPYQFLTARNPDASRNYLEVAVRGRGAPQALLPVFEDVLRELDPEQPYWRLRTAARALAEEEEIPRFVLTLMLALSALAVTLAAVGLYGVLAYSVARRSREIGVRMALGAGRGRLRAMVLGEGLALALAGTGLGLFGAVQAGRLLESLLYEVRPNDPETLAATALLLLGVAAAAAFFPARRATRVDPVEVLRAD